MKSYINAKISMLYQLCLLNKQVIRLGEKHKKYLPDAREASIRKLFNQCSNEIQIEQMLHNVVRGNETIDQMLERKGTIL